MGSALTTTPERQRDCPLCGARPAGVAFPYETSWEGQQYSYFRCSNCRTTFVHPAPTDQALQRLYDQASYHTEHYSLLHENTQQTKLGSVRHLLPPSGDLLDFGCGNGFFLRQATATGFRAEGVELDVKTRQWAAANSGCEVHSFDALEGSGRRFDVIHLGDVLEHLPDPKVLMRRLEALLRPGGRFFIEGPLEENASLVRMAARCFQRLKGSFRRPKACDFPPSHLFRTDALSQKHFFEEVLGYEVHSFCVSEDGWPYWARTDRLTRPQGPAHALRMAIGVAAVATSRVATAVGLNLGNRFSTVLSPHHKNASNSFKASS